MLVNNTITHFEGFEERIPCMACNGAGSWWTDYPLPYGGVDQHYEACERCEGKGHLVLYSTKSLYEINCLLAQAAEQDREELEVAA